LKTLTSGGFTVLTGKNNLQNDYLTFKLASKSDYWFHVKGIPGSHTVLFCEGREPSAQDLTEAAQTAAKNSKAAGQDRVEVDYTRIKNVRKPAGARPGFVIYEGYSTAIVSGEERKEIQP
jgi:predicted ribosome quality control (RQC) complex YloA/Tae2 family protein